MRAMRRKLALACVIALLLTACGAAMPSYVQAEESGKAEEHRPAEEYRFLIDDKAGLLTEEQHEALKSQYSELLEHVHVAFVTTDKGSSSTRLYAAAYVNREFPIGKGPAVIFLIDMANRYIYVYANQQGLSIVTEADARAITDNIYKLASNGDYYGCAQEAFSQILALCKKERIDRPVKHVTNALIAVVAGILITFYRAVHARTKEREGGDEAQQLQGMSALPAFSLAEPVVTKREKVWHSDSSSGGGSGGGGGGGGGSGGGGGGHSF